MRNSRLLVLLLAFLMLSALAFATGKTEQKKTATKAAGEALGIKVWATLAEFEKEGGRIVEYKQSPFLDGKGLPPAAQRVSEEPIVIRPYEEVGVYGGTARVFSKRPSPTEDGIGFTSHEGILKLSHDDAAFVPNVAKSYEWSADGKTLTLMLRKEGHEVVRRRWLRHRRYPLLVRRRCAQRRDHTVQARVAAHQGGFADVEIIDELTFRFRFKDAYPLIMNRLGHYNGGSIPLPSQYLKEYHITYNKEANALAKKEGFDNWVQLYAKKATIYQGSIRTNHEGVLSAKDTEEVTPPASDFASLSGRSAWLAQQDFFAVRNVVYQGVTFKGGDILFAADTHGVIPPNDFELMSDRDAWLPQAVVPSWGGFTACRTSVWYERTILFAKSVEKCYAFFVKALD